MSDLEAILVDLRLDSFRVSYHALQRMNERGVSRVDIINVGFTCYQSIQQADGKWLVLGNDKAGDVLRLVCAYDGDTVIVTVTG